MHTTLTPLQDGALHAARSQLAGAILLLAAASNPNATARTCLAGAQDAAEAIAGALQATQRVLDELTQ